MAYEQREGQGSLFRNDRKERDTQPDFNGTLLLDGKKWFLSAWAKTSQRGDVYLSLSAREPNESTASADDFINQVKQTTTEPVMPVIDLPGYLTTTEQETPPPPPPQERGDDLPF